MPTPFHHWRRRLVGVARPAYLLVADFIADDLRTGRLAPRDRLPTLRDLAQTLGLNYTTVARAYAEARKRGLIDSRPGFGTFVRGISPSLRLRGGSAAEMTMNPRSVNFTALPSRFSTTWRTRSESRLT